MTGGITQVRLDDGTVVWARVTEAQELYGAGVIAPDGTGSAYEDSSAFGAVRHVAELAGGLSDVVRGVVGSLRTGLAAARPHEVGVEFGIELSAQSGKVVSLLADGSGKASIKVSLRWTERAETDPARPETEPAPDPASGDGA